MLIATCSSCGTQNPIDESHPDEIICSGCHKTLHLNYPDTEQKVSMKTRVKTSVCSPLFRALSHNMRRIFRVLSKRKRACDFS